MNLRAFFNDIFGACFLCPPCSAGLGVVNMVKSAMQRLLGGHSKETHKKAIDQFWILDKDVRYLAVVCPCFIRIAILCKFSAECRLLWYESTSPAKYNLCAFNFLIQMASGCHNWMFE